MNGETEEDPGRLAAALGWGVLRTWTGVSRCLDVAVLTPHPKLRRVYLRLWRERWRSSPYRREEGFRGYLSARAAGADHRTLTYGVTPVHIARRLLRWAGARSGSVVYDAGAGRGEVLLAARALGARARGRELVASHVERMAPTLATVEAHLAVGDAATDDFAGVTHVFCAWTIFAAEVRTRLETAWGALEPGAKVITLAAPIRRGGFERVGTRSFLAPWGVEQAFLHRRDGGPT